MVNIRVMQRMVVHHDHFIVVFSSDLKSPGVAIDLMRLELEKGPLRINRGNGAKKGPILGLVFKRNEEKFIMAMGISKFDATVHVEFQRR